MSSPRLEMNVPVTISFTLLPNRFFRYSDHSEETSLPSFLKEMRNNLYCRFRRQLYSSQLWQQIFNVNPHLRGIAQLRAERFLCPAGILCTWMHKGHHALRISHKLIRLLLTLPWISGSIPNVPRNTLASWSSLKPRVPPSRTLSRWASVNYL